MPSFGNIVVNGAVEGDLDEVVFERLVALVGATPGNVYGRRGKRSLLAKVRGYNQAAQRSPWMVIVDMDREFPCATPFLTRWLPDRAQYMCIRIAIQEIEAWLLADRARIARFLGVAGSLVPRAPESLPDPKQTIVRLARRSRSRLIREGVVPRPGSGRDVGPAYTAELSRYVEKEWRPAEASQKAPSLRRAIECLRRTVATASSTNMVL